MSSFHDNYPDLPLTIDVGGDRYYLGTDKPVSLAYKSRKEFIEAFPPKKGKKEPPFPVEYLLRKHMGVSDKAKKSFRFTHPGEKEALIAALEARVNMIQRGNEIISPILKHTPIQRSLLEIQNIIQKLKGTKGADATGAVGAVGANANSKPLPPIPEEKLLQIILELTWYLLHPDQMSPKLQAEWKEMIQELDTLRIGDIMSKIRTLQEERGQKNTTVQPLNYFQKMNIGTITKQPTMKNALEEAVKMATKVDDTVSKEDMEKRLKALLHVLQTKKYLNNSYQFDESRLDVIDTEVIPSIERTVIQNPIPRNESQTLNRPLAAAMAPFSDHFRGMFDPIYGFVESSVLSYLRKNGSTAGKNLLPSLLLLQHISQYIENNDGIYELINVPPELLEFMRHLLHGTTEKVKQLEANSKAKDEFTTQLASLPQIRLSDAVPQSIFGSSDSSPSYVQYFMDGINMKVPSLDTYTTKRNFPATFHETVTSFIRPNSLYITVSNSKDDTIPIAFYQIDMNGVTMKDSNIKIKPLTFTDPGVEELLKKIHLEDILDLDPAVRCTLTEIGLCIWIAFQDLMPK